MEGLRYTSTPLWAIVVCCCVNFTFLIIIKATLQDYLFYRLPKYFIFSGSKMAGNGIFGQQLNCIIVTLVGYVCPLLYFDLKSEI